MCVFTFSLQNKIFYYYICQEKQVQQCEQSHNCHSYDGAMILASYVIYETFPSVINERLIEGAAGAEGEVCVESDGVTCF